MNTRYNQTQFSLEEPFLQPTEQPPQPIKQEQTKVKKPPQMLFIGIALGVVILLVIFFLAAVGNKGSNGGGFALPTFAPSINRDLTPIQEDIYNFEEQLETADPAKQTLVFPPVDLELRLDEE